MFEESYENYQDKTMLEASEIVYRLLKNALT